MKCITIGGATVDIIVQIAAADVERLTMHNTDISFMMVELGRKIETDSIAISIGGGAVNASVAMARMGHTVSPIIKIKKDMNGHKILQLLQSEHIDTHHVCTTATQPTATSVLLSSIERDPTVFTYRGANTQLTAQEVTSTHLQNRDLVYITALSGDSAKAFTHIVKTAHMAGAFVATNPGILQIQRYDTQIIKSFPHMDCITMNVREASALMGGIIDAGCISAHISIPTDYPHHRKMRVAKSGLSAPQNHISLASFMKSVTTLGLQYMVITDGKNGAYMGTQEGIYFAPSIPTQVAGTIGAGDAFASTLASFLADPKKPHTHALIASAINSASVVSYTDTQTGLLSRQDIYNRMSQDILDTVLYMPFV